ncbi:hypothetical protein [Mucilaginibacter pocheonensis]|uniref:Type I restriction enzyme R protein N terminus (HSDR_N) n=1 Tax=Mucilaginibacter pocheonensis TaxID=398050 RepID=A0ABU1TC21_9SPHI|nr:hypothetical protein [Mucilaginibacter pocheonensis]MDR6942933.1 hypothetical protein [Mucilaginibacter pocheonensis]
MPEAIFTDEFLQPYLETFRLSAIPDIQHKKAILQNWHDSLLSGKFQKEEEVKSHFVMEILGDVLGFNYKNSRKWQIKEEHKSVVGATKPDAAMGQFKVIQNGIESEVHIVVEVKGPKIDLDKVQKREALSISPVDQGFLYASRAGGNCKWVIVTNFLEIRFYHYSGQQAYQSFTIEGLQDEAPLKQFLFLFHKDRLTNQVKASTEKLFELRETKSPKNQPDLHILDDIYFTLKDFEGFGFIDPNFLCNIKPFNVREDRVFHFHKGGFLTLNRQIADLMQNFTIENERPVFSANYVKQLTKAKVHESVEKLIFILERLSSCAITDIYFFKDAKEQLKANAGSGLQDLQYIDRNKLSSVNPRLKASEVCQCLNCIYRSLDFKALIKKVKDAEHEHSLEPLEEAYGHYLLTTDNFKKSYFLYKKSELVLNSNSNKVGYFIAKINQLKLPQLIRSYSYNELDQAIKDDIKSIDLDRTLYQELDFYVADDVRKYLIEVKENRLFNLAKESIHEIAQKVDKNTHDHRDLNALLWHYNLLHFYFHKNFFVFDIFSDYRDLVAAIFRSYVKSYILPEQKLTALPEFFLTEAILYVDQTEFKKILSLAGDIKVHDDKHWEIVSKAMHLLSSQSKSGIWNHYLKEDDLSAQLINNHFCDSYTRIFANIFTLLAKIEFKPEQLPGGLAGPILGVVQTEDFLAHFDLAELGKFIERHGAIFKAHELLDMLKHAIQNNPYGTHKYNSLICSLAVAHQKFYPEVKIREIGLLKTAIANTTNHNGECHPAELVPLYQVLDDDGKLILLAELEMSLRRRFDQFMYIKMLSAGIVSWDQGDLFDLYVKDVYLHRGRGMVMKNGEPHYDIVHMINFINQLYYLNIPFDTPAIQTFVDLPQFETWAVNPEKYDYANFEPEWLLALDHDNVLRRLAKIGKVGELLYDYLKHTYQPRLSEIYFKYFL